MQRQMQVYEPLCNLIRTRIAKGMDEGEDCFCIDSKPVEICRVSRTKRCTIGKNDDEKVPPYGY